MLLVHTHFISLDKAVGGFVGPLVVLGVKMEGVRDGRADVHTVMYNVQFVDGDADMRLDV